MNKKANLYLNILSFISFTLSLIIIAFSLRLETITYHTPYIIRVLTTLLGFVFGLTFISIETFLFLLIKNKNKVMYIGYMLVELIIAVLLSIKIPYTFFIVFIVLNIIRNTLRITLVDKLYIPKEFNRYCKMFNIKIKDFPKKKVSTIKKKTINIPVTTKTKTTKKEASATSM